MLIGVPAAAVACAAVLVATHAVKSLRHASRHVDRIMDEELTSAESPSADARTALIKR
jgi:hypothetical protein